MKVGVLIEFTSNTDIEWAKNGQEMVELFQQHQERTKAMLMDIKMPVMKDS